MKQETKKNLRFAKGISMIKIPILSKEGDMAINSVIEKFNLPKYLTIGYKREICFEKGLEYCISEVYIEK